ncbi:MAG TPA: hypothetical protein VFK15_07775 [Burkholderiales bacterium]|nr:hypothetical protein [Burkholderiales bacterium]
MNLDPRIEQHLEQLIDESLEETFPASDPPRPALTVMAVRAELVPLSEAAERYVQLMSPLPVIPTEATLRAAAERLAQLVPLFDLNGNPVDKRGLVHPDRVTTTRAALDAALALMRR